MTLKTKRYTRTALILSIVLLILWISLGTGTTLAWFTDTTPVERNYFLIGEMDLVLSHRLPGGTYEEVKSDTAVFDDEALYEPGYVQIVYLKVENRGDVAFDYRFSIDMKDVTLGQSVTGEEIYLPDYLKCGVYYSDDFEDLSREMARRVAEDDFPEERSFPVNVYSEKDTVSLEPGDDRFIALVVRMPEEVGNRANYRGTDVPRITLGLTAHASQVGTLS